MNALLLSLAVASSSGHSPIAIAMPQPTVVGSPWRHRPYALTLEQFSRVFRPTQGYHRVWLIHPCTGRPVEVCFDLPHGYLTDFEVNHRSISFTFQARGHHHCVDILFRHNGTVDVRNH